MSDEREEIARIIDPWAFGVVANIYHTERAADDQAKAYAKADAILARAQGPGEAVAWRVKDWWPTSKPWSEKRWAYYEKHPGPDAEGCLIEPLYAATPPREA